MSRALSNGFFFVDDTDTSGATVIEKFHVSANPDIADPASGRILLRIIQPYTNHNGGMIAFGPNDGYLYIGMGDGGLGGDPENRAQNPDSLLGKILRIDVDGAGPYIIPPTNPFYGGSSPRPEIWAMGVRNPWRYSFDKATGDLYIADVGQSAWEEIDFQPANDPGGENYGWRLMEGDHCYNPPTNCESGFDLIHPIYEYDHSSGKCAITGGYVYRGCAIPDLQGTYFFGDYCTAQIWSFRYADGNLTEFLERTSELAPGGGLSINSITSFGQDNAGEIYIVDQGGEIFKIVPDGVASGCSSICGDTDGSGTINLLDISYLINYLYRSGPAPLNLNDADVNHSGTINILDIAFLINYLYKSGPAPVCA
jgi:glucose/arabinose dehydrogenase